MAEKNLNIDNLKKVAAQHKGDTNCGSCEDGKATGYCTDCGEFLCQDCQAAHKRVKLTRNHQMVYFEQQLQAPNDSSQTNGPWCPIHPNSAITNFCETCNELLCENCLAAHETHDHKALEVTFPKHKQEIIAALKPAKKRLDEAQNLLESIDKRKKEIATQGAAIKAAVDSEIEQLERLLHQLKAKCLGTLNRLTQQKLKSLEEQRKEVEGIGTKLIGCVEEAQKKLKTIEGVVVEKDLLVKKIECCLATADLDSVHPDTVADLDLFVKDKEKVQQACQEFVEIVERQTASLEDSYITGDGLKEATTGEEKAIVFHAVTRQKKEFEGKLNLRAELVSMTDHGRVRCEVVKETSSQYKITYRPTRRGKFELHLIVDGNPARDSPFSVSAKIGKPFKVIPKLGLPKGTVVNSKGQIVLLEAGGACISILTPEGEKVRAFGTGGSEKGQLSGAWGVTVDKDDNIYVADYGNHRVQKFSPEGEFVAAVGEYGKNQLQFYNPVGICYNHRDNNLYVPDNYNHRIQVLSTDLRFVRSFGIKGLGCGKFNNPFDVAFDSDNNLYIADLNNHCVQVLTPEGRFLRAFSQKANNEKLSSPRSIVIDSSNTVYVLEKSPQVVSVFTSEGAYVYTFGEDGTEEGQFKNIFGISVDHNDSLIVSDYNNGRLQIF